MVTKKKGGGRSSFFYFFFSIKVVSVVHAELKTTRLHAYQTLINEY